VAEGARKAAETARPKSGLKRYKTGEVIFNENDPAESLYIIQTGQVRLYKPKGKGFIELAVLRSGEVIGEMAYFDNTSKGGGRRSCSAQTITATEVVEISFKAFEKTMANLNPWFKTIIETLAQRLRKTNAKVKELESNQVAVAYGKDKGSSYSFFRNVDIVRMLSVVFMAIKSHGTVTKDGINMHKNLLKFYAIDIFGLAESKYEEFINLLDKQGVIEIEKDESGMPNIVNAPQIEAIRHLLVFFNNNRTVADDKKITIGARCEFFMDAILKQVRAEKLRGDEIEVNLTQILEDFKYRNLSYDLDDLEEARDQGFCGEAVVDEGNVIKCTLDMQKVQKVYKAIKLTNVFEKFNRDKSSMG